MITLYQFESAWGLPNFSPFCMKVETYLRMVGLDFQVKEGDVRKAPKGKLPFIDDDGKVVADSEFILDHLKKKHGDKLDEKLTNEQRAVGHLIRRTLEESTYFIVLHQRWSDERFWGEVSAMIKPKLPPVIGSMILPSIRKQVLNRCAQQGISKHTDEEIAAKGKADLTALAVILGDKKYFLGDEPSSVDACAYAFLANVLYIPFDGPLKSFAASQKNIVAYCERMKAQYYPTDKKG